MGQALATGLRAGAGPQQVPVWLNTPMTGLQITDGRVTGVEVTRDGEPAVIRATRGVLLATGGFERNEQMRQSTSGADRYRVDHGLPRQHRRRDHRGRGGRGRARPDG